MHKLTFPLSLADLLLMLITMFLLYVVNIYNPPLFYGLIELFMIIIGCCVFIIMWSSRAHITDHFMIIIGVALLFISGFDLLHLLSFGGPEVFGNDHRLIASSLWDSARYLQAVSFLLASLGLLWKKRLSMDFVTSMYGLLFIILVALIMKGHAFPEVAILSVFKTYGQLLIAGLYASAIALLYVKEEESDESLRSLRTLTLSFMLLSALLFMIFDVRADGSNTFGQLSMFIAYFIIFRAVVKRSIERPSSIIFHSLSKSERELEMSKAKIEELLERRTEDMKLVSLAVKQSIDGIAIVDLEGKVLFVNDTCAQLTGYSVEELSGRILHDLIDHKYPDGTAKPWTDSPIYKTLHEGAHVRVADNTFWKKDGTTFHAEYRSMPVRDDEHVLVGAAVLFRDMSERKIIERRVEELGELRGRFLNIMSRMLSTPLTAINWNLEEILGGSFGKLTDTQQEFLSATYSESKKITERISDLLLSMDIEEKRIFLMKEKISLRSLCAGVIAASEGKAKLKNISMLFEAPEDLPSMIGDGEKMRMVVRVLVDNAITYSKNDHKVIARLDESESLLKFEIVDSGIGIPEIEQKRIFSRFFRATNASVMQPDSFGIGLSVAKYIIEQHGGKIGFQSVEGSGSRFWFEVPGVR